MAELFADELPSTEKVMSDGATPGETPAPPSQAGKAPPSRTSETDLVSLVVMGLAVVALGLAVYQTRSAFESERLLRKVEALATTRHVGSFPENMDALISLLSSAKREIVILVDSAGYGHFSRHGAFEGYRDVLRSKSRQGVKVSIAVYTKASWHRYIPPLFTSAKVEELKESGAGHWENLDDRYRFSERSDARSEQIQTMEDLVRQLWQDEANYRGDLPGVRADVDQKLPLFCWIVDGNEAIFSILVPSLREGFSVRTADGNILGLLERTVDAYSPGSKALAVERTD